MKNVTLSASPVLSEEKDFFYFKNFKDFEAKKEVNEIYEISTVLLNRDAVNFCALLEPRTGIIERWFDYLKDYSAATTVQKVAITFLVQNRGYDMREALCHYKEVLVATDDILVNAKRTLYKVREFLGSLDKHFDYYAYALSLENKGETKGILFRKEKYTIKNAKDFKAYRL